MAGKRGSAEVSAQEVKPLLAQLTQQIADNNPAAEETVERLLQGVDASSNGYEALAAVRDAIDIFDFSSAATHLAAAQAAIDA